VVNIDSHINMNEFGHIYLIENLINHKKYVGQSINIKRRIFEHLKNVKNNENHPLYDAINKYGLNNFTFQIIDFATNIDELNNKEIILIEQYQSNINKLGYNLEAGGKNSIPNEKTLIKMSLAHKGIIQTDDWIENRIAVAGSEDAKKYGKTKTDEEKLNLSIKSPRFWLGKERDKETRNKISETKLKNGLSDKQKEVICKKVYKIYASTNEIIKKFESTADAANFENVNQSTISRWCSKNKIIKGILWKY